MFKKKRISIPFKNTYSWTIDIKETFLCKKRKNLSSLSLLHLESEMLHQNLNSAAGAENFSSDQMLLSLVSHDFPMEHSPSKQGLPNPRADRYIFHHVLFLTLG